MGDENTPGGDEAIDVAMVAAVRIHRLTDEKLWLEVALELTNEAYAELYAERQHLRVALEKIAADDETAVDVATIAYAAIAKTKETP